ncbi:alpha/beta fold hydrolase, partial [Dyella sp.]|uniref:thioesterase domain-containing protein n=1 Tax=Dyella sp. TaxID=1869338 RepID=UPI002B45FB94
DDAAVAAQVYEAPQGEVEQALAELWQELLGLERVGRHDHFFELGGHSLLAVELVSRAKKALQMPVALTDIFVKPVLKDFAARICGNKLVDYTSLVPVRKSGNARPLFMVHGGAGGANYVQSLARWIDPDIPLYGLVPKGYMTEETPLEAVEDMACRYIKAMRSVQPQGPYRIAGWSSGGIVAYEMAVQLLGMDETVEFIGMLDTYFEQPRKPDHRNVVRDYRIADFDASEEFIAMVSRLIPGIASGEQHLPPEGSDFASVVHYFAALESAPESVRALTKDLETTWQYLRVCHANRKAEWSYVPHPISAPVTLFSALKEDRSDRSIGWSQLLHENLQVVPVDGWHFNLVEDPYAEGVSKAIVEALRDAESEPVQHVDRRYNPCITIQGGRSNSATIFCVPGAGASITSFADLMVALDPHVPVHGLQPRGLCGVMAPHLDVTSAARAYLQAIKNVAPGGPYHLIGHSYGGWVALEMALQLEDAGERVLSTVVLDSQVPTLEPSEGKYSSDLDVLLRLVEIFELKLGIPLRLSLAELLPLDFNARLELLFDKLIAAKLMPPKTRLQTFRGIYRVFSRNLHTGYMPYRPYRGSFHVAVAGDVSTHPMHWHPYAPNARVWQAPGNHMTLLTRPHVEELAEWLLPIVSHADTPV